MAHDWIKPEDTIDPDGFRTIEAIKTASETLFALTGEKFTGIITSTDAFSSSTSTLDATSSPALIGGQMYNLPSGAGGVRELTLRNKPVRLIESVEVQGRILDPSEYSLRGHSYIVRKSPNMWVLDSNNEILVTYKHGVRPPTAGKAAATRLANEIILWYMGSPRCALPERITSVARQGVSYTILDPQDFIGQGKTGIYSVDSFIAAVNPDKQRSKPALFNPRTRIERIN